MSKQTVAMFAMMVVVAQALVCAPVAAAPVGGACFSLSAAGEDTTAESVCQFIRAACRTDSRAVLLGADWWKWCEPPRYHWDLVSDAAWYGALHGVGVWVPLADSAAVAAPKLRQEFLSQCRTAGAAGVVVDPAALPEKDADAVLQAFQADAKRAGVGAAFQAVPTKEATEGGPVVGRIARAVAAKTPLCILPLSAADAAQPVVADLVRRLPVAWGETKALALPGAACAVARRAGAMWFVAVASGAKAVSGSVALPFLGKSAVITQVVHDAEAGVVSEQISAGAGKPLAVSLPPNAGLVAVLATLSVVPDGGSFVGTREVRLQAADGKAEVRYTLDGTAPGKRSARYTGPITLSAAATVRARIVRGEADGAEASALFTPVPAMPPCIFPDLPFFPGTPITVSFDSEVEGGQLRYTLDGSDPTAASPLYKGPFKLEEPAIVSVSVTGPGLAEPITNWREYGEPPPADPNAPHFHLSDLKPAKFEAGWGGPPKKDLSIQNNPLSVAGQSYERGIGTHAVSEIVYPIRPEYKTFVTLAGVDDEHPGGSVVFAVYIDDKLQAKSNVIASGQKPWQCRIDIPAGSKALRLIVGDGGNGVGCDHADWLNAGFQITK